MDPCSPDFAEQIIGMFTAERTVEAFRTAHLHVFESVYPPPTDGSHKSDGDAVLVADSSYRDNRFS